MSVLYRKYRPQKFGEVVGQEAIVQTLQNALKTGKTAHAYLFTGSRGVGKTTVARILAKALNCLDLKDGEVCLKCKNCLAIGQGNFLDLVEIDAASNTGVDNIRELIEHTQFTPSQGLMKVFIIDEVHMLSRGAFNALLKTLEEPPSHVVFVLATTEIQKVPATIISRSQRFDFKRLSEQQIETQIEKILKQEKLKLGPEIYRLIALRSEGSLRDALSLLDKVLSLGTGTSLTEAEKLLGITSVAVSQQLLSLIIEGDTKTLPEFFSELLSQGIDFVILARDFLEYLRKVLVFKISGTQDLLLSQSEQEKLSSQCELLTIQDIMYVVRLFLRAYKDLGSSPSPELPMLLSSIEAAIKNQNESPAITPRSSPTLNSEVKFHSQPSVKSAKAPKTESKSEGKFADVTLEEVKAFWPVVLEKLKGVNSPLATLVKNSPLETVSDGIIVLSVKYVFHKEHLESVKNYSLITQTVEQASGKRLGLRAAVLKNPATPDLADEVGALADALKVFGGELVE